MKHMRIPSFLLLTLVLGILSCSPEECVQETEYIEWAPVYFTLDQMKQDIRMAPPKENKNPGKIYSYGNLLLINELFEGVHIIDNTYPKAPVRLGFIPIAGNVDIAMSSNVLYADNYANLLSIDLSDPMNPKLKSINEELFKLYGKSADGKYLVRYDKKKVVRTVPCNNSPYYWFEGDFVYTKVLDGQGKAGNPGSVAGIGGSFARFTLVDKYLYVVNHNELLSFDVSNPLQPLKCSTQNVAWDIETIFPYEDFLFVGSRSGMYIFGLNDPRLPNQLSKFVHSNGCDPVFVSNDIAYITLRDGNECNGFTNQLDIVEVKDLLHPVKLATHNMKHPHGLSVDGELMVLCEGLHGFKTIELLPNAQIRELAWINHHAAYDVIILERNRVLVIGQDGLYQYDMRNPASPRFLSKLI